MTITLTPETEARLLEKTRQDGEDINALAERLILSALDWEAQERAETIAAIQWSEHAALNGRERPLAAFISEQRDKHEFPATWPGDITKAQDVDNAR